jgi:hypothetical protein
MRQKRRKRDSTGRLAKLEASLAAATPLTAEEIARLERDLWRFEQAQAPKDRELALALLLGVKITNKNGLPSTTHLKPGSSEELEAREALVRALRSDRPIDRSLREALANVFDPRPAFQGRKLYAQLKLEKANGASTERIALAHEVWAAYRSGGKIETIADDISKKYSVSRRTVLTAWTEYSLLRHVWEIPEPEAESD